MAAILSTKTGLVYDEFMLQHYCTWDPNFQECPERMKLPFERCCELGLVDRCQRLPAVSVDDKPLSALRSGDAGDFLLDTKESYGASALFTLHTPLHVEKMKSSQNLSEDELKQMCRSLDAVFMNNKTYACAKMSLGSTVSLVEAIVKGQVANGLALVRPPGHHAMKEEANGYCIFNNVAVAAKHCLTTLNLERVLIVDWDVHHGQGTQFMFYDDPRVMYISIHRYEHGWFWPNLRESNFDFIGSGAGSGFNINVPLNKTGMTDSDYFAIFHQIIMPIAMEYNPDVVLVSAGYDCALGCPEGLMEVSPPAFGHFVHTLRALADGKVAVVLEGGYNLQSLTEAVGYTVKGLLDDPCPLLKPSEAPCGELVSVLLNSINVLRPYWTCLNFLPLDYQENAVNLETSDERGEAPFMTKENRPAEFPIEGNYTLQTAEYKANMKRRIEELVRNHLTRQTACRTCYVCDDHELVSTDLQEGVLLGCKPLHVRRATDDELLLVHSSEYMEVIRDSENTSASEWNSSATAAGNLLNVVDSVMTDSSRNGFAILHAEKETAFDDSSFLFNNLAIAAKYAQNRFGVERVAIIDLDQSHDYGSQQVFENDPSVLYVSLHDTGSDAVEEDGYNINIPLPLEKEMLVTSDLIAAFQRIIIPVCYQFAPDLILVAAGTQVTSEGFAYVTHCLSALASGRVIVAVEGLATEKMITACARVLMGEAPPRVADMKVSAQALEMIGYTICTQSTHWSSLCCNATLPYSADELAKESASL